MTKNFSYYSIRWLDKKKKEVKYSTYCAYQTIVYNHLNQSFCDVSDLTVMKIDSFEEQLMQDGLSQKSIKDIQIVLKMILKDMIKDDLVSSDLIEAIKTKKDSHSKIDVLSKKEYKTLFDYLTSNFSFRNLGVLIAMCTGMRIGEICALKWKDINLEENDIHVHSTLQRVYDAEGKKTEIIIDSPKTENSDRFIPLSTKLRQIIKPLCKIINKEYYVISNDTNPLEPRTFRNYFNNLLDKIGLRRVKFHILRHSFATRCVEASSDYKSLSSILGHSNIGITLNLYVHPNNDQKKKCIDKMLSSI